MFGLRTRRVPVRNLSAALVALAVCAVFLLWLNSPPDPRYKGKRLSEHLDGSRPNQLMFRFTPGTPVNPQVIRALIEEANRRQQEAQEAVSALGPKAIPLIGAWLQTDSFGVRERIRKHASKPGSRLSWLLKWRWVSTDPREIAYSAAYRIPQHGAPLLPILRRQLLEEKTSGQVSPAADLIGRILNSLPPDESRKIAAESAPIIKSLLEKTGTTNVNPSAIYVLALLFRHDPSADREEMVRRLWPLRTMMERTIAVLDPDGGIRNLLYLERGTILEKPAAALFFRDSPRSPDRLVPLLQANLTSTNHTVVEYACAALGAYGSNAGCALPALTNLLNHRGSYVARAASNAILKITGASAEQVIREQMVQTP